MIHLGAKQAGIPEAEMTDKVRAMSRAERKDWMRKTCDAEGINFDYMAVDEGHDLLNRAGKEDSILANVADSISDNSPYYINASGDPVKNDVSEAFDLLSKMDPARYTDLAAYRAEQRRYLALSPLAGRLAEGEALTTEDMETLAGLFPGEDEALASRLGRIAAGGTILQREIVLDLSRCQPVEDTTVYVFREE